MAIILSDWAAGRKQAAVSGESGVTVVEKFTITLNDNLAIGDKIELGTLPAYHHVVDATLVADAMGAGVTVDVGIMSGTAGSPDDARTVGDELFDGTDVATASVTRMSKAAGFLFAPANDHRGIGVIVAGAGITGTGQVLTLVLTYAQ